jgi:AcrR family transcriptional regulator
VYDQAVAGTAPAGSSLRQEHRDTTRRRIVAAARKVFAKKGYFKATIEDIIAGAGVSRATLYLHFDSKLDLLYAAAEKMAAEGNDAAQRLAVVLIEGDRDDLRAWIESALAFLVRNRPMALAAQEAELSVDRPTPGLLTYLDFMEPWVATWPVGRRREARQRFELCRLQMHHYMWGKSPVLFDNTDPPVDLFTEIWWNALKVPLLSLRH